MRRRRALSPNLRIRLSSQGTRGLRRGAKPQSRPVVAYRQRGRKGTAVNTFNAPEVWHEPTESGVVRYLVQPAGPRYVHAVTVDEVRARIAQLPPSLVSTLEVVQLSGMTRKRALFPCYGMQWGTAIYLYPMEKSLIETYIGPPKPRQIIEARMYGGRWEQTGNVWKLHWTAETIRDFYLNNVLIHEIGHVHDTWNNSFEARERYANWFAEEWGYRVSRGRRSP